MRIKRKGEVDNYWRNDYCIACWIIRTSEEFERVILEKSLFRFEIHKERKKSPDEI